VAPKWPIVSTIPLRIQITFLGCICSKVGRHTSLVLRPFPREKDLVCSDCAYGNFSQLFGKQYFSVYFPHIKLIKELCHVLGWRSIGALVTLLILCVFWCCSLLFGSVGMADLSPKKEQRSTIKAVLEAHSFFIQLC